MVARQAGVLISRHGPDSAVSWSRLGASAEGKWSFRSIENARFRKR